MTNLMPARAAALFLLITVVGASSVFGQAPPRYDGSSVSSVWSADARHESATLKAYAQRFTGRSSGLLATATSHLEEKTTFLWDDQAWTPDANTMYVYTEQGRVAAWHSVWNGTEWTSNAVTKTTPFGRGYTLTLNERYDPDTQDWFPVDQTTVDYLQDPGSGAPYVNWTLLQTWDGEDWMNVERETFAYTESWNMSSGTTETWDGTSWQPESRFVMAAENSDVVQLWGEWNGAEWVTTERMIFRDWTVEDLLERLAEIGMELADYEDVLFGLHLIPAVEAQEWDGTQWVTVSRQVRTYDLFTGDVIQIITQVWEDEAWHPADRLYLTYESAGVLESLSYDFFDGESWMTFLVETYTRDDEGSIIEAVQQSNFGEGLTNTAKVVFEWSHTGTGSEHDGVPDGFALDPAYPNPFNPETNLTYRLGAAGHVDVRVYDMLGRPVAILVDGTRPAGLHAVTFHAADLPSGQYIIKLDTPGFSQARIVTLLK